ncbi:hypothetical protein Hte_012555 [Hypoxylon texense]
MAESKAAMMVKAEPDSERVDALEPTHVEAVPSPSKEGLTAWIQVLGAFILNLNAWAGHAEGQLVFNYRLDRLLAASSGLVSHQHHLGLLAGLPDTGVDDGPRFRLLRPPRACCGVPALPRQHVPVHGRFLYRQRVLAFIILATSAVPVFLMKANAPPRPARSLVDRSAFRDAPFLMFSPGLFFGLMGFYIVLNYIKLLTLARTDITPNLAGYLLVIINAASLPGRLIPGYYADYIGSVNVQTIVVLAGIVLTFSLLAVHTAAAVVIFSSLYGFITGAFIGLPAAGIISLLLDKSKISMRLGIALLFIRFGLLISNPNAGAILSSGQN